MSAQDPGPLLADIAEEAARLAMTCRGAKMRPVALLSLLVLFGCASAPSAVTLPMATSQDRAAAGNLPSGSRRSIELNQGFEQLRLQDQRVADIAFRLAATNADLCPDRRALSGLTLHTPSQYSKAWADALADRFPKPQPGVLAVAATSPAALAGVRPDDLLISIDGKPFAAAPVGAQPTIRDTEAASDLLGAALSTDRAAILRIDRGGREMELPIKPVLGCAYPAALAPASNLQPLLGWMLLPPGSSRGMGTVTITERMAGYAHDDSELAFAIGHEDAHNLLHHPARIGPEGEAEADYVGLYLMARAGYDIAKVVPFWIQLSRDYPEEPLAHSSSTTRIARLIATVREIEAKRAAGAPLIPNFIGR